MRKGKSVIGKDVISFLDGKKVHSVKDLLIGMDNRTLVALLVSEGGLFSTSQVVPMQNVVNIGKDAVVISDSHAVVPADAYPAVQAILDRKDKLMGKKVLTEGGDDYGSISDLYFDDSTGALLGYEVSGGIIKNVASGTRFLSIDDIVNMGPDVILIKSESVNLMEEQTGGVQGALETAGGKIGGAVDTAKDKIGDAAQNVGEMATDKQMDFVEGKTSMREVKADDGMIVVGEGQVVTRDVAERADRQGKLAALVAAVGVSMLDRPEASVQSNPESDVIGKSATTDVEADDGSYIVAAGQRINQNIVERARTKNKLNELLVAAGVQQAQGGTGGGGPQVGAALGTAGDKVGDVAGQAADKGGQLWDDFLGKVQVWKDQAGERVDEEKTKKRLSDIQDAVGRPVTKVILDKQDNVVLNLGDIITHTSIQSAYDAGMLDTLLDSVYKGDVTFTRDEMRAPVEGEATVEKASGGAAVVDEMEQKVDQAQQERDQKREEGRAEAEQKREENEQEREVHEREREQKPSQQDQGSGQSRQQSRQNDQTDQIQQDQPRGQQDRQGNQGSKGQTSFSSGDSQDSDESTLDAPTQEHEQAKISDEEFERGSKTAGQGGSSGGSF